MILKKGARDRQLSLQLYSEPGERADGNTLLGGEGAMLAHDEGKAETLLTEPGHRDWPGRGAVKRMRCCPA